MSARYSAVSRWRSARLGGAFCPASTSTGAVRGACARRFSMPWSKPAARMREFIQAMQAIWRNDAAEFHGEFVNFDPIWSWPKPVQAGGPPIWIGANADPANRCRSAALAKGQ